MKASRLRDYDNDGRQIPFRMEYFIFLLRREVSGHIVRRIASLSYAFQTVVVVDAIANYTQKA